MLLKALAALVRPARRRDRREGGQGGRLPPRALRRPGDPPRRRHATRATAGCRTRSTQLWPYTGEMFVADEKDAPWSPPPASRRPGRPARPPGRRRVRDVLTEATLTMPDPTLRPQGRQARRPHRASRLHPRRHAVPAARLSRRHLVGRDDDRHPPSTAEVWDWLGQVPDPEIPVISLTDLGIIRDVAWDDDTLVVTVTPTYSGCPATA